MLPEAEENGDGSESSPKIVKVDIPSITNFAEITASKWYKLDVNSNTSEKSGYLGIDERVGHALISYPKTKKIFMLGGGNHSGDLNEVWEINYTSPSEPLKAIIHESRATFPSRYEFSCATNEKGQAWIFGGADFQLPRNDVVLFDLENETIIPQDGNMEEAAAAAPAPDSMDVPSPRTQGNNCCHLVIKAEDYLAVFGGGLKGDTPVPDGNIYLYKISTNEWQRVQVKNQTPDPVQGHAMVAIGTRVYVHGGMRNGMNFIDQLYMIDLDNNEPNWIPISPTGAKPSARAAHGIIPRSNEFVICGGLGIDGALNDVWTFNTESSEWTQIHMEQNSCPPPRFDFAMTQVNIPSPEGGKTTSLLLLHGGMNTEGELFKDFWAYPLAL